MSTDTEATDILSLPFDLYTRYYIIAKIVTSKFSGERKAQDKVKILDVGGKYPLYYIDKNFEIDVNLLESYEKHPEFRNRFVIITQDRQKSTN